MPRPYITTSDNPYNPATDFDRWNAFDLSKGYNTCAYLDRVMITSPEYSQKLVDLAKEAAIDEICKFNVTGTDAKYVKIYV